MSTSLSLPALPAALRAGWRRLPTQPPSALLAAALNRLLLPRLEPDQRQALAGQIVEVEVLELGLRVRLALEAAGFRAAATEGIATVTLRARADALWRLLCGQDDADRLFFERALVMEGDTEYGLVLKNTLDAIGPLIPALSPRGTH
ncbi:putative lipid carrier protein YhbT [Inhella inkyongensis]|uniref:Ubiquinone biosynthesis accessory factor UbiT n=1 Tax=Inhella inkyongensis TaxID=392593 RepID=A0A840S7M8_9BURK|nr:SCP2 sterol-binding domain-containing protein [Inhella inkyongensis]MBB5205016.1 putative lipid carrier protein YhbT [Inhella inkyongensis]